MSSGPSPSWLSRLIVQWLGEFQPTVLLELSIYTVSASKNMIKHIYSMYTVGEYYTLESRSRSIGRTEGLALPFAARV